MRFYCASKVVKCCIDNLKREYYLLLLFVLMGGISAFSMVAAPMIPPRSMFGTTIFWLIASTISIHIMSVGNIHYYHRLIVQISRIFLAIITPLTMIVSLYTEVLIHENFQRLTNICNESIHQDVVIPWKDYPLINKEVWRWERYLVNHDYMGNHIAHMRSDPKHWMNQAIAAYYDLNSIRIDINE
jgi:ABC-type multidrug transport system permease subunit